MRHGLRGCRARSSQTYRRTQPAGSTSSSGCCRTARTKARRWASACKSGATALPTLTHVARTGAATTGPVSALLDGRGLRALQPIPAPHPRASMAARAPQLRPPPTVHSASIRRQRPVKSAGFKCPPRRSMHSAAAPTMPPASTACRAAGEYHRVPSATFAASAPALLQLPLLLFRANPLLGPALRVDPPRHSAATPAVLRSSCLSGTPAAGSWAAQTTTPR